MFRKINIGLIGFGCVGQGLYQIWKEDDNPHIEISKVVVKNDWKERSIDPPLLTTNTNDVLNDPEINVIVEVINNSDQAFELLRQSLQNGKAFITANKKMIAEHLAEIFELQKIYGLPVLYEGAVCGSIPILRNLEGYFASDQIHGLSGIFNGSTNYILTDMFQNGSGFKKALEHAQQLGLAEANPSLDVGGFDPKYKLAIAITHAFGTFISPSQILNLGIDNITNQDIQHAKAHNLTIKLIAQATKFDGEITAVVAPKLVKASSLLGGVSWENNAIEIESHFAGTQALIGKGAGSLPTGFAVWADIIQLQSGFHYKYEKIKQKNTATLCEDALVNVRVSSANDLPLNSNDFEQFCGGHRSKDVHTMIGWIRLQSLAEWSAMPGLSVMLEEGEALKPIEEILTPKQCLI